MKAHFAEHKLNKLTVPVIQMKNHQQNLRRILLTSSHWNRKPSLLSDWMVIMKGGENNMNFRRFALSGLVVALIIVVGVFTITHSKLGNSTVYAKEVAQKTYQAVASLSPTEQEGLKKTIQFSEDPKELLNRAQNAKDLTVLTYDQFLAQSPKAVPPAPKEKSVDIQSLKFLKFTDADGSNVILGVNPSTNLPAMILVSRIHLDGEGNEKGFGRGMIFKSHEEGDNGPSFGTSDGAKDVKFMMNDDGKPTLEVNGKKYKVPENIDISIDKTPPSISMQGDDVYINGTKVEPE